MFAHDARGPVAQTNVSQRSPFTQRVHIALEEARADYTFHVVDLLDRQTVAWYTDVLNPSGKVV